MTLSRRRFIQMGSLASASMFVPKFLKGFEFETLQQKGDKILIVIQLSGGNDGLNTIIPYRNDVYYSGRPVIGIKKDAALSLTDDAGINPAMKNIKSLYDQGNVSIINNVGYAEPNRSHFRSMDIWQSGSASDELITTGWLGRYLDNAKPGNNVHHSLALEVDDTLSLAMKGAELNAIAARDINQFHAASSNSYFKKLATHEDEHTERLAGYLYKTMRESTSAADYLYAQNKIYNSLQVYPDTPLGKKMKTTGSLIGSGSETRVYYISHGGFDTHVHQAETQDKLLGQLDDALNALVADLKLSGKFNDVLIMTFSEFGRRVAQNASNGTDHGTANNMLFIGGGLKKAGLYNELPDLTDLDNGDIKYSVDFKDVYATVLDKWLNTDAKEILGKTHGGLTFI